MKNHSTIFKSAAFILYILLITVHPLKAASHNKPLNTDTVVAGFTRTNPFAESSKLFYQAPPFDKIFNADYQPAIEEGMRQHIAEVNQIASSLEPPTFENTIIELERSGAMLTPLRKYLTLLQERIRMIRYKKCRMKKPHGLQHILMQFFLTKSYFTASKWCTTIEKHLTLMQCKKFW